MNRDDKIKELKSAAEALHEKTGIVIIRPTFHRNIHEIAGKLTIPFGDNRALLDVSEGLLLKTSFEEKLFSLVRGVVEQESFLTGKLAPKNSFILGLATNGFGIMAACQHGFAATYMAFSNHTEALRAEGIALTLTAIAATAYNVKSTREKNSFFDIDAEAIKIAGSPEAALIDAQEKEFKKNSDKGSWFKLENFNFKDQSLKEVLLKAVYNRIMEPAIPSPQARIEKIQEAFSQQLDARALT
jgi:hypothetical protein